VLAWRARFGDPFLLRAFNGDIVMTGRADLVKAIFGANPDAFAPFGVKAVAPVVGEQSLLILGGEAHRRQRKLLMPPFHGARMRAYAETMREVTVRRLEAAAGSSADASLQDLAQQITLEIIVRAIFGVEEGAEVEAIADGIVATVDAVHPAFLFMPWLQRELGGFGPYARFRRAFERGDRELQELIEARRRRPAGDDILWMLLEARHDDGAPMSDAHLRDELRTLIVAGHETTAMTIAFLVDNLYRSPHALARARDEAVQVEGSAASALATLPYLDAVAKETLRLRPIVTEVMRTLRVPMALGDVEAPAGMHLGVSMALAHFDPEVYPDPQAFRPERFLERQFTPAEYLPFGGGSRRCIGAAFADMEIRIAMATLLASFDVTLRSPEPAVPVRRNITMGPAGGVPVRLARRRPRAACAPGPRPADAS
jgi:cytochrome P450